ncbi:hypothetical protein QQ008_15925 [Fulvivirgaceae bacterium BMA10]|uniref:Transglutaminase-like domain-containing protein n=1 Tax=Splendidivirga corallicola TaxID=3051826 RepID=A0ABT8KQ51_9BACT|nr:hypothetical protein [Fulvivirgaceae bacterium BMA10]
MKGTIKFFIFFIAIFILLVMLIGRASESDEVITQKLTEDCQEHSFRTTLDNKPAIQHRRAWLDYSRTSYCTDYHVAEKSFNISARSRNNISISNVEDYAKYWGNLYKKLYQLDAPSLKLLEDSLQTIRDKKQLNRTDFAHAIVTFVQDIPYSYIINAPCSDQHRSHPCVENIKYGILSPIEFLYTLNGDCDTRSVLLYALFRHFNYEPLVVISAQYQHAMLALNITATGEYLAHKGKKFYFWETTNVGWKPGMLPPDVNNKRYWKIALDYEY